jgi:hypothetical protein
MLLFESKLMTETHEKLIINQAEGSLERDGFLKKKDFLNIEFWFEKDPNVNVKICNKDF